VLLSSKSLESPRLVNSSTTCKELGFLYFTPLPSSYAVSALWFKPSISAQLSYPHSRQREVGWKHEKCVFLPFHPTTQKLYTTLPKGEVRVTWRLIVQVKFLLPRETKKWCSGQLASVCYIFWSVSQIPSLALSLNSPINLISLCFGCLFLNIQYNNTYFISLLFGFNKIWYVKWLA